jgi:hypothetical protein
VGVLICISIAFHFPLFSIQSLQAQVAGLNTLSVLDLGSTARSAGVGMDWLPLYGGGLAVGIDNPSLLHASMAGTGVLSFVPMYDGSNMGSLSYAHSFGSVGTFAFGFHFFNYGRFQGYDEEETYQGDFGAGDYALTVGWGMWLDSSFSVGVNFKPVLSQYESYTALAAAFDLSGSYTSPDRSFSASLMARNVGAQLLTFDGSAEPLPFELSAALSYKLRNAPFRLFFAATELQRWDLRYDDPLHPTSITDPFSGEVTEESWLAGTFDNLMRHTLFGVELGLGRLYASVGYSWRQTAEMRGVDAFNLSGFAFGVGLRTRRLEVAFARRNHHLSQAPNYITLSYKF